MRIIFGCYALLVDKKKSVMLENCVFEEEQFFVFL